MNKQRTKESLKLRAKNPYFWIGLIGTFLLAAGIEPSTLTTWPKVLDAIVGIFKNPYVLVYCTMSILGDFVDPTTPGMKDARELSEEEYIDI